MSREIKFRAWNLVEKTMGKPVELTEAIRLRPQSNPTINVEYMQYTGLKDKKGQERYGDL